jgi:hypothetical protein
MRPALAILTLLTAAQPARADVELARSAIEIGVGAAYLASGKHRGFGASASALWGGRFLALGATFDVARLGAKGTAPNGQPFDHAYGSALVAALFELRAPVGRARPYLDLALGFTAVDNIRSINTQCHHDSGLGAGAATGVKVDLGGNVAAGLRASVRLPSGSLGCGASRGPWSFSLEPLIGLAATADYYW